MRLKSGEILWRFGVHLKTDQIGHKLIYLATLVFALSAFAQEETQYQYWFELAAADESFADRSTEIGRARAFLEFLGQGSVVFREGPIDALELYRSEEFQRSVSEISWKAHYIDVSRAGDLGLSAGPLTLFSASGQSDRDSFGHLISVWRKFDGNWQLMADIVVPIPGFLSLDVEPSFEDTLPVLAEAAHPVMATIETNSLQSLIEADNRFGQSINFRGGQRALLRYGLDNTRVYLPGMAPAIGVESASLVYGAFLDDKLSTTNPVSLNYVGGFLSDSKEMGYTYGTMASTDATADFGFRTSYLRLWRLTQGNDWKIAVEVLSPY